MVTTLSPDQKDGTYSLEYLQSLLKEASPPSKETVFIETMLLERDDGKKMVAIFDEEGIPKKLAFNTYFGRHFNVLLRGPVIWIPRDAFH